MDHEKKVKAENEKIKQDKEIIKLKKLSAEDKLSYKDKQEKSKLDKKYRMVTRKNIRSEKWTPKEWLWIVNFLVKICNLNKKTAVSKNHKTTYDFGNTKIIDTGDSLRVADPKLALDVIIPNKDFDKADFLRGNPRKLKRLIEIRFKKELETELAAQSKKEEEKAKK